MEYMKAYQRWEPFKTLPSQRPARSAVDIRIRQECEVRMFAIYRIDRFCSAPLTTCYLLNVGREGEGTEKVGQETGRNNQEV